MLTHMICINYVLVPIKTCTHMSISEGFALEPVLKSSDSNANKTELNCNCRAIVHNRWLSKINNRLLNMFDINLTNH